ncbi:hypothetical protein LTS18_011453, partial [Coniosporium uncinatum]
LTPKAYKTHEERLKADIPAVSTFREKGSKAVHQDANSNDQGDGADGADEGKGGKGKEANGGPVGSAVVVGGADGAEKAA